jgi:GNAT superfamily N-acetyltransferase
MTWNWIHESVPYWDEDKARIIGAAEPDSFPVEFEASCHGGSVLPGDWWRVADENGRVIAFAWMDVTWGDAEMLLVVDAAHRNRGIGTWILDRLEDEARARGLNYLYNRVSHDHPLRSDVVGWLRKRSFLTADDGTLFRAVIRTVAARAS